MIQDLLLNIKVINFSCCNVSNFRYFQQLCSLTYTSHQLHFHFGLCYKPFGDTKAVYFFLSNVFPKFQQFLFLQYNPYNTYPLYDIVYYFLTRFLIPQLINIKILGSKKYPPQNERNQNENGSKSKRNTWNWFLF